MHRISFIFIVVIFLSVFSCSTATESQESAYEQADTTKHTIGYNDSSVIMPANVVLTDSILRQIHRISPWTITMGTIKVDSSSVITDIISQIRYNHSDGVGSTDYLVTFSGGKYLDLEILDSSPDMDLSGSTYTHKRLHRAKGSQYIVTTYIETVADTNILDPSNKSHLKSGYSFDQVKTKTDSVVVSLFVKADGGIQRDTIR
jgi:hypothetical protein